MGCICHPLLWNVSAKQHTIIEQVKHFLPIKSLHTLYFAFIQPHISYGILAWGNAYSTICQKTILLQKRALRLINNVQYNSHTDPLFKRSKILKINDLYEYQIILFMNDFAKKKLPNSFDNIFKYNCDVLSSCPTRQSDLMFIERCDSTFSARLPLYNFHNIYNNTGEEHALVRDDSYRDVPQNLSLGAPDSFVVSPRIFR